MEIPATELLDIQTLSCRSARQIDLCLWKRSRTVVKKKLLQGDHTRHKDDLIKEVTILLSISHENIVAGLGYVQSREEFSLIMEYCVFESYHKHFIKTNYDYRRCGAEALKLFPIKINILRGVAGGMAFLHKQPFLHLRLKPENVLLDGKFEPRVANFGKSTMKRVATLSTIRTSQVTTEQDETPSLFYMAPEHLVNPRNKANTKTDVYAFGILAWQVLTDLIPFTDIEDIRNPSVLTNWVCSNGKRPNENEIPKFVPSTLIEMINICWSSDFNSRPEFDVIKEKLENLMKCQERSGFNTRLAITVAENLAARARWASVKSMLPNEEGIFRVQYGNFRITLAIVRSIRLTGLGYECEARDSTTGSAKSVEFDISARVVSMTAVAYLIRAMIGKGIYPRPVDEEQMNRDVPIMVI